MQFEIILICHNIVISVAVKFVIRLIELFHIIFVNLQIDSQSTLP